MTRPDEIAALADEATRLSRYRNGDTLAKFLRDVETVLRRLVAASPGDAVRMREALEPFAREADNWADTVSDDYQPRCTEPGNDYAHPGSETTYTVGDLRRAKAAIAPAEKAGDEIPYGTHAIDKLSAKKHSCRQLARYIWERAHNTPMCFEQDIARLIENERRMAVERSKNITTPTPASSVGVEKIARIVEEHLDNHTFEKNDDGSIVIDRAGMILTMSEDERLTRSASLTAQSDGPAPGARILDRDELRQIVFKNSSLNMTLAATHQQSDRIADAIVAAQQSAAPGGGTEKCPNCNDANEYGDYEGPTCEKCMGHGVVGVLCNEDNRRCYLPECSEHGCMNRPGGGTEDGEK